MNNINSEEINSLILQNKNLIHSLVNQTGVYSLKEDLYQVGIIGLINAYHNFDTKKGTKFSTYAYSYILGEIKRYIRENTGLKISRDIFYLYSRIEKVREKLQQQLIRNPTTFEIASFLEIEESKVEEVLKLNLYIKSLDEPITNDGKEIYIKDTLSEETKIDNLDLINLKESLSTLSDEERRLLYFRYFEDKTQAETGKVLGLSQVQVSRGEQKILLKLKDRVYH